MTNLAGHDIEELSEVFLKNKKNKKPACFLCYTVKGFGLPLAGHKDNHSGIMNIEQFKVYQDSMNVEEGKEWNKIEGVKVEEKILRNIYQIIFFIILKKIEFLVIKILNL